MGMGFTSLRGWLTLENLPSPEDLIAAASFTEEVAGEGHAREECPLL